MIGGWGRSGQFQALAERGGEVGRDERPAGCACETREQGEGIPRARRRSDVGLGWGAEYCQNGDAICSGKKNSHYRAK